MTYYTCIRVYGMIYLHIYTQFTHCSENITICEYLSITLIDVDVAHLVLRSKYELEKLL